MTMIDTHKEKIYHEALFYLILSCYVGQSTIASSAWASADLTRCDSPQALTSSIFTPLFPVTSSF